MLPSRMERALSWRAVYVSADLSDCKTARRTESQDSVARFATRRRAYRRSWLTFLVALTIWIIGSPRYCTAQVGGVKIDASGLVQIVDSTLPDGVTFQPNDKALTLTCVSMNGLRDELDAVESTLPAEVRHPGGLVRVTGIAFRDDPADVILIGESDQLVEVSRGVFRGKASGRPPIDVFDLLSVLRYTFPGDGKSDSFIGCSIDPTPEGTRRLQAALGRIGRTPVARLNPRILASLSEVMGPQAVTIYGVEPRSYTALKLVSADMRLKRLAMGLEASPVKGLTSYLQMEAAQSRSRSVPQHRWWFVPKIERIRCTADKSVFELNGLGIKVRTARSDRSFGEDGGVTSEGASPAARKFAETMSRLFPQLRQEIPAFAELENLASLALVSEIAAQRYYDMQQPASRPQLLESTVSLPSLPEAPAQTPAMVSWAKTRKGQLLISISGGVQFSANRFAGSSNWESIDKLVSGDSLQRKVAVASFSPDRARWWWKLDSEEQGAN